MRRNLKICRLLVCALAAAATFGAPALAQNPYCNDLRAQIARAGAGSGRQRAAAAKQQAELARASAYARSIGCERQQFLFFGDAPPPQCGQLNAKIARLRANIESSPGRGDDSRRQILQARYDEQCRQRAAPERNFLEELFGLDQTPQPAQPAQQQPGDWERSADRLREERIEEERPQGGSEAVCVRRCDGAFFPIMYSARRADLDDLNLLCKALCPNAEAELYTKNLWKDIDTAVSVNGDPYRDLPNALKFQKAREPDCSCKAKNQTWAEALGEAERILEDNFAKDAVVTAEEAERLSRPPAVDGASQRSRKNRSTRRDAPAPETASADGAAPGPQTLGQAEGAVRQMVGPDGAARRVRVVAPEL